MIIIKIFQFIILYNVLKYYGDFNFKIENVRFINKELTVVEDINEKYPGLDVLTSKFFKKKKKNNR